MTQSTIKTRGNTYDREVLVQQIAMMRIESKSTYFILEFLEKKIGMGRANAYLVLKDAQQYIVDMAQTDLNKAYEEAIQQIERKMDGCDRKLWLEYRKELNKLQALYKAQKIDISGQIDHRIEGVDVNIQYTNVIDVTPKRIDNNEEEV